MAKFIQKIIDEIVDQYLFADETNRPWVIGFSGGKEILLPKNEKYFPNLENLNWHRKNIFK